jgi:hypothetical protein
MRYLVCCGLFLLAGCTSSPSAHTALWQERGSCYFQGENIGSCSSLSVAPTGKYAVFLDSRTELVHLFTATTGKSEPVSLALKGPILSVIWHDDPPGVDISAGPADTAVTMSIYFPDGSHQFIGDGT